jgi:pimeloyl-ACP methyl ester carboxylesterase
MGRSKITLGVVLLGCIELVLTGGCAQRTVQPDIPGHHGIVFYLDGAGGGSLVTDWGRGVKSGLTVGGYKGVYREFHWQTGLGVLADQDSSVAYKRGKARELARIIVDYANNHPGEPINLIGLSAGTAVAIYTLEALPSWCTVDKVILLGSSVNANYDLASALVRIEDNLFVFTSPHDAVLGMLVPFAGTADRQFSGSNVAGIQGFQIPVHASQKTRQLYTKVKRIPWDPAFAKAGDHGGHTDATHPRFVAKYITLLLIPLPSKQTEQAMGINRIDRRIE